MKENVDDRFGRLGKPVKKGAVDGNDEFDEFKLAKSMHPGAKSICQECHAPIYEVGGKCPNCEN